MRSPRRHLPTVLRMRRRRAARARRAWSTRLRPWGFALLMVLGLLAAGGGAALAWGYAWLTADLPSVDVLPAWLDAPRGALLTPTRFRAADGSYLTTAGTPPSPLTASALPKRVADAVLAAVEPNFWHEHGYPGRFWQTDKPPGVAERLAQQLLLPQETPSLRRRLRARVLAARLIARYGHRRTLTWFLNIADFGHHLYGLDAASRAYLGKPATDLSLPEAALLAATLPNPHLNPWDAPAQAEQQRQRLLMDMLSQGMLSPEQATQAITTTPKIRPQPPAAPTPPLLSLAQAQLRTLAWPLPARGLDVTTTLDPDLQAQADCLRLALQERRAPADQTCPAARLLPPAALEPSLPPPDALEAAVLDAADGRVLALSLTGDALQPHPPGGALAPWVYAVAFATGFSPANLTWDIPANVPAGLPITNPDGRFHGPLRLRLALANDDWVPTLHLLDRLGPTSVWTTAARIGLPALAAQTDRGFGLMLSQGRLTVLDLAHGAAALATLGRWPGWAAQDNLHPAALQQVLDAQGNLRLTYRPVVKEVLDAELAYLVTDVLADPTAKWPSLGHPNPLEIGRPVAAHVGHTLDHGVWVLGYTPQRAMVVYAHSADAAQSQQTALAYWHALAWWALREQPADGWTPPPGIVRRTVCDPSGLLPTADCPNLVEEVFLQNNVPHALDDLYRRVLIDRETGLRATVYTPPQLVESRVFMLVPPEARAWAQQAGLPLPPEEHDLLLQPPPSADARLTSPGAFAVVRGTVTLRGTAAGPNFAAYRVQVGEGLNPQAWEVVAEGQAPVQDGVLGQWHTQGRRGLYAVQLLVTDHEGRVQSHTVQVTVDAQPPQVRFAAPRDGETVRLPAGVRLVVRAEASDDIGLAWVRLEVDGRTIATYDHGPYVFALRVARGQHHLRLSAADRAGQRAEAEATVFCAPAPGE